VMLSKSKAIVRLDWRLTWTPSAPSKRSQVYSRPPSRVTEGRSPLLLTWVILHPR
jgi:hypothetical protein